MQLDKAGDPKLGLYVPAGQLVQLDGDDEPVLGLYVPAGHSTHDDWPTVS